MRPKASTALILLVATACVAPVAARSTLAGGAALLFEAAPFVLAAAALASAAHRFGRDPAPLAWAVRIAGCGCGYPAGAASLAAFALCWVAFGAPLAVARAVVGIAAAIPAGNRGAHDDVVDPIGTLTDLVPWALAGSFAASLLGNAHFGAAWPLGFAAGALTGALSPCTAGAVALASALRTASPAAAAGLLCTAGIVSFGRLRRPAAEPAGRFDLASATVGIACALLVARHGAGFVHPRILPLIVLAAVLAAVSTVRRFASATPDAPSGSAGARWLAPAVLLSALALGSPLPALPPADATSLADAFAGERLHFVGIARPNAGGTTLVRFVITCCRADASPVSVRLDHRLAVANGVWVDADGRLVERRGRLLFHTARVRVVTAPADPFAYR